MRFFITLAIALAALPARAHRGVALVYSGEGAGAYEAAAEIPARMGFQIRYVKADDITSELFKNAKLWVQPGGDAIVAAQAMGPLGLSAIREFVRSGGGYVGFCAGAFLADKSVNNSETMAGLGIIPVGTFDYPLDNNNGHGDMTWINWGGKLRHVFFDGGGSFYINNYRPLVKVLATFAADGLPVTIETQFGRGHVVVSGAHPEATFAWKSSAGVIDRDGPDYDLAADMVRRAIQK